MRAGVEDIFPFIIVYFLIAATAAGLVVVGLIRKRNISGALLRKTDGLNVDREIITSCGPVTYHTEYREGDKNTPSYLKASVPCKSLGNFRVVRENRFDGFFKDIGISCEIQTRDPEFDKKFYVLTDDADFASVYFGAAEKRGAVQALFGLGVSEIKHDGKQMEAKWSPFELKEGRDLSFVGSAAGELARLCKDIPESYPRRSGAGFRDWRVKRSLAFAVPGLFLAAGLPALIAGLEFYTPLDGFELFLNSLKYSLPLLAGYLWLVVRLLKGRSGSHRELLFAGIMSVSLCIISGYGIRCFLNGYLDSSSPVFHETVVIAKHKKESKNSMSCYVRISSWRRAGEVEKLKIPFSLYREIVPAKTVLSVATRPGRFGFEWIASVEMNRENSGI